MKNTYTNRDIIAILNTLNQYQNSKLPQKISYAITKNTMVYSKEYECYEKELTKLKETYDEYIVKNDKGEIEIGNFGIPKFKDTSVEKEFITKLNELLSIEVEVNAYHINEECFNYDDTNNKYDSLSPSEMLYLQRVLCGVDN